MLDNYIIADRRWTGYSGIGRYSRELLPRIDHKIGGYIDGNIPTSVQEILRGLKPLKHQKIIYSPGYMPVIGAKRQLITVHDLILLKSGIGNSFTTTFFNKIIRPRIRDGSIKVITVSQQSKIEIADWANISTKQIDVVKNGLSSGILDVKRSGINRRMSRSLLFVGSMKKHKNFHLFSDAVNLLDGNWKISLVGPDLDATQIASRHRVEKFYGISDTELANIYLRSQILVNTSSFEGFGMPFLEGGYLGCKVVHLGVIPTIDEVLKNESIHTFGSFRASDLAEAIACAAEVDSVTTSNLRTQLASEYSWDRSAAKLNKIFSNYI